jgi:hypothetical protein
MFNIINFEKPNMNLIEKCARIMENLAIVFVADISTPSELANHLDYFSQSWNSQRLCQASVLLFLNKY